MKIPKKKIFFLGGVGDRVGGVGGGGGSGWGGVIMDGNGELKLL